MLVFSFVLSWFYSGFTNSARYGEHVNLIEGTVFENLFQNQLHIVKSNITSFKLNGAIT
jgi:hypothetical protein